MTPAPPSRRICVKCNQPFLQETRRGRPHSACPRCRVAARKKDLPPPDLALPEADLNEAAEDLNRSASDFLAAVQQHAPTPLLLYRIKDLQQMVEDAEAAAIRRGRLQGDPWKVLAQPMNVSQERLRKRWTEDKLDRRLHRRRSNRERSAATPHRQAPSKGAASPTTEAHGGCVPTMTPRFQFASAVSCLQRQTGWTIKETASEAGVSASYMSRIVNGTRLPSWGIVERIHEVCGGDLTELRDLWEAAQRPPAPDTDNRPPAPVQRQAAQNAFHAALRGLYLSADRPHLWALRHAMHDTVTISILARTLKGSYIPDWPVVARLVFALHGRPADLRPLWQAAYQDPPQEGPRLAAGSFG
ncbi:helix-turn-helix transcriptional regulator [Streptomyces decoyicus]|uniref:helix-turn-helix domain-containing protein n=1 Tax=Streptomyces decoyicus TaxID=249567 RepID=UPI0033C5172D